MLNKVKNEVKFLNSYGIYFGLSVFLTIISVLYRDVVGTKAMEVLRPYISMYCIIAVTYIFTIRNKQIRELEFLCKQGNMIRNVIFMTSLLLPFMVIILAFQIILRKAISNHEVCVIKDLYYNFVIVFFFLSINIFLSKVTRNKYLGVVLSFVYCFYSMMKEFDIFFICKIFNVVQKDSIGISLVFIVFAIFMILYTDFSDGKLRYFKETDE